MWKNVKSVGGLNALRTGQPSITIGSFAFGGAVIFGSTAYFSYRYAKAHVALSNEEGVVDSGSSFHVFDKIADKYDEAIGQEEAALWYGMMRRWLLHEARGDVLEVSVGTGRNFQYYNLDNQDIKSLTFTDLSPQMLLRAEDKFFDELQLGYKHPHVRTTFCLADAHCLVDRGVDRSPVEAATGDGTKIQGGNVKSSPWWAYWGRRAAEKLSMEPGSSATPDSTRPASGDNLLPAVGTLAGYDHSQDVEPIPKAMPGLHARGLMNFFRVLAPPPLEPEQVSPTPGLAKPDVIEPRHGTADIMAAASSTLMLGPSSGAGVGAVSNERCSCQGSSRMCCYVQRCNAGRLDSGTPLRRFAPGQFDTVVDTFGLCSHEDPIQALKEMARVCKEGGKILLLEHGRSHYEWLNSKLDSSAAEHQRKWGCMWNKDILELIRQAGLQVDKVTRWHFGTSYYIIARPTART
ncbi:hypothetical protein VaNZ11_007711 [Volvox africanus]|uniref:Methyltransferase type 11 domain-containing protein n=1 Tax=Volvox africanus TaxID=51714 RepID=A0ABQ5S3K5_9CHLO|nr:hypothetical protein VaNZ11_007711 [Volvox africanus]